MAPYSHVDHSLISVWARDSVLGVFKTTFGLNVVQASAPHPPEESDELIFSEIRFEGTFTVSIRLCISAVGAARLSSIALRMPAAEICDAHVDDLVGEMSNMVLGAVKSRVSDLGVPCRMLLPTVTRSQAIHRAAPSESGSGMLYFLFEKHCLAVEISLTHTT
jgi:CheY-specific phosphatase CheX